MLQALAGCEAQLWTGKDAAKAYSKACAQNNFNSAQDATAQKSVHQPAANRFSTPCDNTHVIGVRPAARWMYCLV